MKKSVMTSILRCLWKCAHLFFMWRWSLICPRLLQISFYEESKYLAKLFCIMINVWLLFTSTLRACPNHGKNKEVWHYFALNTKIWRSILFESKWLQNLLSICQSFPEKAKFPQWSLISLRIMEILGKRCLFAWFHKFCLLQFGKNNLTIIQSK
jgi:hypothetical protein